MSKDGGSTMKAGTMRGLWALLVGLCCCAAGCHKEDYDCEDEHEYEDPDTGYCYRWNPDESDSWQGSRDFCIEWHGDLVTLPTQEKMVRVLSLLPDPGDLDAWIGATDDAQEGNFRWVTGEPWTYPAGSPPWNNDTFDAPEPNGSTGENCVELYGSGRLNDERCSDRLQLICERPPVSSDDLDD
jgi:hypothetical protein